jgi:hypothetical protein
MQRKEELIKAIDIELPWEFEDNNKDDDEDDENDKLSKIKKRTYYPRDIDDYINCLKKYDQIIGEYKQKNDPEGLIVLYGALIFPENCNVTDYIPTDNAKKYETTVKAYERDYPKAIALIQSAPAINFSLSRVEKDSEKKPRQKKNPR